jgi:DNA-binding winged helix-turn-helix (wHTH) protein
MKVQFGDFSVDGDARQLCRGETSVHLSPKAFLLLELLLKNRPRAMSKAELQDAVWPDVFVLESNLTDLVSELRSALDQAGQRNGFIRTLHGFGYAFSADASEEAPSPSVRGAVPSWRLLWQGGQLTLSEGEFTVGRDPAVPVFLDDPTVSWTHARIQVSGSGASSGLTVTDLESRNGTFLNDRRLEAPAEARHGDELRMGSAWLAVRRISQERSATKPIEPTE